MRNPPARNKTISVAVLTMLCLAAGLMSVPAASAADEPGSWSLDFKGGATYGQFTFDSRVTGHGGFQLRYSMNPVVSLFGSFGVGVFRADESMMAITGFSNDYFMGGLGARVNVLRMLAGASPAADWLALYTTTGLHLMRADVRVRNRELQGYMGSNFSGNAMILSLGAGTSVRINRRIDLFLQGELHHSDSDLLDGYERLPGATRTGFISGGDSFIKTSAGISIKLGSSETRHTDWRSQEWERRSQPTEPSVERELARLQSELERSDRIKEELARRLQSLAANLTEFSELINTSQQQQLDAQDLKLEQLQRQVGLLQSELNQITDQTEPGAVERAPDAALPHTADTGQPRHYLVAGAFRNRENAEGMLREIMAGGFSQASIITDAARGFYIVSYASYATREQAEQELVRIRSRVNPDAWIFAQ
jgi:cell division protein FtsN